MAHKKGEGSTSNGRDSNSKRLGVKLFGGQDAIAGNILVRQKGSKFHAGKNVGIGKDWTLYALTDGVVKFTKTVKDRRFIHIITETKTVEAPIIEIKPIKKSSTLKSETTEVEAETAASKSETSTVKSESPKAKSETPKVKSEKSTVKSESPTVKAPKAKPPVSDEE